MSYLFCVLSCVLFCSTNKCFDFICFYLNFVSTPILLLTGIHWKQDGGPEAVTGAPAHDSAGTDALTHSCAMGGRI